MTTRGKRRLSLTELAATVLLAVISALLPDLAQAATDDKSFPATSCRRQDGNAGQLGVRLDGGIENESQFDTLTVVCPVVRDNTQTTAGWTMTVRVIDNSANGMNGAVSCTTSSMRTFGNVVVDSKPAQTGAVSTGAATLVMSPTSQWVDGYSTMTCTLPPHGGGARSKLFAYRISEPDGGDSDTDQKAYTAAYAEIATPATVFPPFITYQNFGLAIPTAMAANDEWILPIVRDESTKKFSRVRLRLTDSDADKLVECWVLPMNEDGTITPIAGHGSQDAAPGQSSVVASSNAATGLGNGPLTVWCDTLAVDANVAMYDVREKT